MSRTLELNSGSGKNRGREHWSRVIAVASLLFAFVANGGCDRQYTEEQGSDVVKLRNDLKRLASGEIDNLEGRTEPTESYVLLFGYQGPVESLSVPESLHRELNRLTPWDYERYVLVKVVDNQVKEYTQWEQGRDPQFTRVPILIHGQPFKITVEQREPHSVAINVE